MAIRVRPRYPHMGPIESEIWHKFLAVTELNFIRINYDVSVGRGYIPAYLMEEYKHKKELYEKGLLDYRSLREVEAVIESASYLTKLRIDVVAETSEHIWIIEVKPRASKSALGQLECYRFWYVKQHRPAKAVRLAIVCYDVDRNVEPLFNLKGIRIFKL